MAWPFIAWADIRTPWGVEQNLERAPKYSAFDLYFLAMSQKRLGQSATALTTFHRADDAAKLLPVLSAAQKAELASFRKEAEQTLGISKN